MTDIKPSKRYRIDSDDIYIHITPLMNLKSILQNGFGAKVGFGFDTESDDYRHKGITYFFKYPFDKFTLNLIRMYFSFMIEKYSYYAVFYVEHPSIKISDYSGEYISDSIINVNYIKQIKLLSVKEDKDTIIINRLSSKVIHDYLKSEAILNYKELFDTTIYRFPHILLNN